MRRKLIALSVLATGLLITAALVEGKGRGGGGGGRGVSAGGAFGGRAAGGAVGGGAIGGARVGSTGSYTGSRGGSIDYGGAHIGGSGPFGGVAGAGAGGVRVTTPGGATAGRVGAGAGAIGPGGRGGVERAGAGGVVGPAGGVAGSAYRGGVAFGPGGAVAGGTRVGGVGVGGINTVNRAGTYRVSNSTLRTQGTYVRTNWTNHNVFNTNWYRGHPAAWFGAGWTAGRVWNYAAWPAVASYCSFPAVPVYYDYGSSIVFQDNRVYINGSDVTSATDYSNQSIQIADAGRQAIPPASDDFQPLGVFGMVQGDEQTAYKIFQLAVNKQGVIRGNYYDALADNTLQVYGQVDKTRQLACWSIGEKKDVVYETGIANLTQSETPVLVHFGADNTQQLTLIRLEQPADKK